MVASEFGLAPGFKEINFDEEGEFSKTGKGDAFRIFSTIFAMTKDYVDMYDEGISLQNKQTYVHLR